MRCPSCDARTPKNQGFCKHCGAVLLAGDEAPHIGPYRLEAKLGEGGMGVVYRATDEQLHREVAVKILHPAMLKQENLMERFRREARMHAKMIHPNIVTLLSLYEDGEHMALVMEMVHGRNLKEYLRQNPRPALPDVIRISEAVCSGLTVAHNLGMVHRDLKPANILLAADGSIKLMDFGLAKPLSDDDDLTQSGAAIGSFRYMAPEQVLNQPVDARTDLYALGILMYQMTTGKLPFNTSLKGGGEFEIMEKQVRHDPESPRKLNLALPVAMSDLIMALLAKNPDQRPASCEIVHKALTSIIRKSKDPQKNIIYSRVSGPQNNVEIARGLLYAWSRQVLRLLQRVSLYIKTCMLDIPDRFQAALVWTMIIIVMGVLGWGLTSLIRISEQASPDSGTKPGYARLPTSVIPEKKAGQTAHKVQMTAQRKPVAKAIIEPVKNPGEKNVPARPVRKAALSPPAKPHPSGEKAVQPVKKIPTMHKTPVITGNATGITRITVKPVTYHVAHRIVRSDGSSASSGVHEFRGGKRVYFESLENYALKDKIRSFKSGWIRLYLTKSVKLSRIVIHRASVGKRGFRKGEIRLEVQGSGGHWQTLLLRKDRAIDRPLSISKPGVVLADVKGVRFRFKSSEPITIGPIDLLP